MQYMKNLSGEGATALLRMRQGMRKDIIDLVEGVTGSLLLRYPAEILFPVTTKEDGVGPTK